MKNGIIIGVLVVIVLVVGGILIGKSYSNSPAYSTSPTPTTSATTAAGTTTSGSQTISISNFAFSNPDITVHVGDSITWTNNDSTTHTVTSIPSGPLNSGDLAQGKSYTYTFTTAGTFNYHCAIHANMTGTVTVE